MIDNNLVLINEFVFLGQDNRGLTSEFRLPRNQYEFIYITRKKGSVSGNTYHHGKKIATNPKIFILLGGKILLSYRKIGDVVKYQKEIITPSVIQISPYVTHKVEALEDFLILECNSIQDIQEDRTKEEV